ncbi:MAG TPA: D-aminoacylase [Vicinamibacterales bacterium]|nr:D-aminoacylase [Vicinamibacterales bacterium]
MRPTVIALLVGAMSTLSAQNPSFELLVRGGRVIDGTGAPARRADVGIRDGTVAVIGDLSGASAKDTIEATGLVVAPGFVDVHTHADDLAEHPLAENFVRMGVTTIVAGNCGSSSLDIAEAFTRIRSSGASVNFATLIGHNTVRSAVMGTERRPPRLGELDKMKSLVWKAMADGAVGFSTGLQYVPGTYAETPEIIELAKVAGSAGGIYASHMRNEGTALEEAVRETIAVGETAMCRVQVSHLKVDAPSRWGASARALDLIDAARKRGVDVRADQYAYTAASSNLGIRFPSWVLEGGQEKIRERLTDAATWQRVRSEMKQTLADRGLSDLSFATVASHAADPSLNGLTIKEAAAKQKGSDSADAQFEQARDMLLAGGATMVYHFMSDEDVDRIMRHPEVGVASDASVLTMGDGVPHPRGYGNNARVLGRYVRERRVITLEEAIRKMTSLPASHFRFGRRGVIREGWAADLVIFDPARVTDAATFERPHAYAAGIPHVVVNGIPVVKQGKHTAAKPGQVVTIDKDRANSR